MEELKPPEPFTGFEGPSARTGIFKRLLYLIVFTAFCLSPVGIVFLPLYFWVFHEAAVSLLIAFFVTGLLLIIEIPYYFRGVYHIIIEKHITFEIILNKAASKGGHLRITQKDIDDYLTDDEYFFRNH